MNPVSCLKTTLKEIKTLLGNHPDNAWLKKWARRFESTLKEVKAEGYTADFERFWKAYPRTRGTSKSQAYGNWCKINPDSQMASFLCSAAVQYGRDCKKAEISIAHPSTWLSPTEKRWESYEGMRVKIVEKTMCRICKDRPFFKNIGVKVDNGVAVVGACVDCQKYDFMTKEEIDKKRLHLGEPEKKGKDTATLPTSLGVQESASGSLSEDLPSTPVKTPTNKEQALGEESDKSSSYTNPANLSREIIDRIGDATDKFTGAKK